MPRDKARVRETRRSALRYALPVAWTLGSLVPEGLRLELLRRALADESPSQRWAAIRLLDSLEQGLKHELAAAALADETDPALTRALTAAANPS